MINLNTVVNDVQVDLRGTMGPLAFAPQMRYRILEYALRGCKKLNFLANPKVSVYYFTPNAALVAPLPDDYEFYTKVAIIVCGVPYTLGWNPNIPLPRLVCGVETPYDLETCDCTPSTFNYQGFEWASHYRSGQFVGEFYSLGGGWNTAGYFRIDLEGRRIVLQNVPSNVTFMMEYVSNGTDGGATLIEEKARYPIRSYVHWQLTEYSPAPENAKQRAQTIWREEFNDYKKIALSVTIDEFMDAMYAGFTPGIKGITLYG